MRDANPLEALFPPPRRSLLMALYGEPERWWSLPELAGRAGVQPATLRHHLADLNEAGLVRERTQGGRTWFQPDPACPIFEEMQSIVTKLTSRAATAETILVVEDQPATAQITRILLESWGYRVLEAHCYQEAREIFTRDGDGIHLLLTDVIMPDISGPQLAGELTQKKPDLRVVFMSGYPNDHLTHVDAAFLPKPFNPSSLSRMVRKELDRPVAARRNMKGS